MKKSTRPQFLRSVWSVLLAVCCWVTSGSAQDAASPAAEPSEKPISEWTAAPSLSEPLLLQIQEQQSATLRALEKLRAETVSISQRNDEVMSARLKIIEDNMASRRATELEELRAANRTSLTVVAACAGAALVCMLVIILYLLRVMRRVAESAAAVFPTGQALVHSRLGGAILNAPAGDEVGGERFLSLIHRLEKRVYELEHTARPGIGAPHHAAGEAEPADVYPNGEPGVPPRTEREEKISSLLGKGLTLLNMGQADAALTCYEEVIALDPANTEALVKKGKALEKLRRMEEAIESYDRALEVDKKLTIAYLGKGGVYNRLERYAEALECYEKAMQSQSPAASSS